MQMLNLFLDKFPKHQRWKEFYSCENNMKKEPRVWEIFLQIRLSGEFWVFDVIIHTLMIWFRTRGVKYLLLVPQPIDSCATRNRLWRALAFLPLLTSSLLTKIGIIYTPLLQEEKIFPLMPRSEWSAEWSLRYAQKCSKIEKKTQTKISCHYIWLLHGKNCLFNDAFLEVF